MSFYRVNNIAADEKLYDTGIKFAIAGKFKEAAAEFKKVLNIHPFCIPAKECLEIIKNTNKRKIKKETVVHLFKAINNEKEEKFGEAVAELREAIKITPDFVDAYCYLGIIYGEIGLLDESITEFRKSIEIDPDLAWAYNNLGIAYEEKGLLDEAIVEFKKAVEIDPDYSWAHYNLGKLYDEKNILDESIEEYKKAIEIDPSHAWAHNNLGLIYEKKEMLDEAIDEFEKVVKIFPSGN
ncbi:MAG: tetratricopeptide repeat protein [Firmicutes bacterium]|nr:tetratricopeptide repeat protein [Bacillota bacterium]